MFIPLLVNDHSHKHEITNETSNDKSAQRQTCRRFIHTAIRSESLSKLVLKLDKQPDGMNIINVLGLFSRAKKASHNLLAELIKLAVVSFINQSGITQY